MNLFDALRSWLNVVNEARSRKTFETYSNASKFFRESLRARKIDTYIFDVAELDKKHMAWMLTDLKHLSPATEKLYLTAIKGFYTFVVAENLNATINLESVKAVIRTRARRPGVRIPNFNEDQIQKVLEYVDKIPISQDPMQRLIDLRDRALILALSDSGLRIHEALKLTRGSIDLDSAHKQSLGYGKAIIIGKGDKQAQVRFGKRSIMAISLYLKARAELDGASGKPLLSLPVFARHDKGTGKKIKPITPHTGRNIVERRVAEALGDVEHEITPHTFRHYFVTQILKKTHNLKHAQILARHESMNTTGRYAHADSDELDAVHEDVFSHDR